MKIKAIEKSYPFEGTVVSFKNSLPERTTNTVLHQVTNKLNAFLQGFVCPEHPEANNLGTIEVIGQSIKTKGASFETKATTVCCKNFETAFEQKVGEFFDQYRQEN